ncbi:OmpH family outer membrane protein [Selenihalanaerobacter shriftii]|uniref:Periplasmic chaperone for outer membrane proteins Skp n=1 Tax=Selenihalanaerobacter shriftii TaxID=142842 RepID=A0A1T4KYP2_9FIRM|nr:OmpH family outer membrane protein [Selenihalanaerobacter shriftii]SJZ47584.1 periplasmic chaperone for outer membrane proteins Skp [Selenihalanaerobacter shriftii]
MKVNKSLKLLLLAIALLVLVTGCTSQKQKIGIVDMKKVVEESKQVQKYQQNLDQKLKELQSEYEAKLQDIKDEEKLKDERQKAYKQSQKIKEEMEKKLRKTIQEAVKKVAKEEKIDIVVRKAEVQYGGINITDQVIKSLE